MSEPETYLPADMLAVADAEVARLRKRVSRDANSDPLPTAFVEERTTSLLLACLLIEMRELRSFVVGMTQPAEPESGVCSHPLDLRVDESRMGQEPGTAFYCPACKQHVNEGE